MINILEIIGLLAIIIGFTGLMFVLIMLIVEMIND
jgi:hypothetical protein